MSYRGDQFIYIYIKTVKFWNSKMTHRSTSKSKYFILIKKKKKVPKRNWYLDFIHLCKQTLHPSLGRHAHINKKLKINPFSHHPNRGHSIKYQSRVSLLNNKSYSLMFLRLPQWYCQESVALSLVLLVQHYKE